MARQEELDKLRAKLGIGASRKPRIAEHHSPPGSPPPSPGAEAQEGTWPDQPEGLDGEGAPLEPPSKEDTDQISLTDLEVVLDGTDPHEGLDSPTGPPPP